MLHSSGRCTNIDYCSIADARQVIDASQSKEGFRCPECARPVAAPAGKAPGVFLPVLAGVTLLAATGGALYVGLTQFHAASSVAGILPAVTLAHAPQMRLAGTISHAAAPSGATSGRVVSQVPAGTASISGGSVIAR
jgi:hypothetical protein